MTCSVLQIRTPLTPRLARVQLSLPGSAQSHPVSHFEYSHCTKLDERTGETAAPTHFWPRPAKGNFKLNELFDEKSKLNELFEEKSNLNELFGKKTNFDEPQTGPLARAQSWLSRPPFCNEIRCDPHELDVYKFRLRQSQ